MSNVKRTLVLALAVTGLLAIAPALYAHDSSGQAGSMMNHGMMGDGSMMGHMSRMMKHCSGMMGGSRHGDRPNDRWRDHNDR